MPGGCQIDIRLTLNNFSLRSSPAVSITGRFGEGWNWTDLMTPSDRAEILASRSRSIDKVPLGRALTLGLPRIPPVEVRRSLISSSSLSSVAEDTDDRLRFVFPG